MGLQLSRGKGAGKRVSVGVWGRSSYGRRGLWDSRSGSIGSHGVRGGSTGTGIF